MPQQDMRQCLLWIVHLDTIKFAWHQKMKELLAFHTPKVIYCYKVMLFGLKNVGATYQRAMENIFEDMLHKMLSVILMT